MTREVRQAARRRVPFLLLWLVTAVLAVVSPQVTPARAEGNPGGPAEPPPPDPLVIPASWYDTIPAASVDYLPASSTVTPSGQFTLSIPIDTPPARGMGPSLAFSYAGTGDGLLGVGWSLGGLSAITRCRKTLAGSGVTAGIRYLASDQLCLDEQPLVVVDKLYSDGCKEYRTERDGFARIVGCGQTVSGPLWFRVWTKAGQILLYEGVHYFTTEEAELDAADVIPAWPLRDAQDRSGNLVRYTYEVHQDDGEVGYYYRPLEIEYTRKAAEPPLIEEEAGLRKVVFDYEPRPDPSNHYLGGMPYGMPERLSAVRLIAPNPETPEVVARYELSYEESGATGRSLLTQIRRCDGAEGPQKTCLWAKQLTWWQSERPDFDQANVWTDQVLAPEVSFFSVLDADGDGKDDLLAQLGYRSVTDLEPLIYLFRGSGNAADHGFLPPILVGDPYSYTSAFHHVDLASSRPADLDGDGKMELLAFLRPPPDVAPYVPGFQWFRWNEDALIFEPFGDFLEAGGPSSAQLGDFDGDGLIDMLRAEPAPAIPAHWLLHRNTGGDLSTFQATDFLAFEPGRAVGIDVDGDGRGELFAVDPVDGLDPAHLVPLGLDDVGQFGPLDASWVVQSQGPYALSPVFADITGDGLRDALFLFDDPKQVRINAGRRFLAPQSLDLAGQLIDTSVRDNGPAAETLSVTRPADWSTAVRPRSQPVLVRVEQPPVHRRPDGLAGGARGIPPADAAPHVAHGGSGHRVLQVPVLVLAGPHASYPDRDEGAEARPGDKRRPGRHARHGLRRVPDAARASPRPDPAPQAGRRGRRERLRPVQRRCPAQRRVRGGRHDRDRAAREPRSERVDRERRPGGGHAGGARGPRQGADPGRPHRHRVG